MPIASVSNKPVRKDLKTLPGGYVDLRRMSYGEKLDRLEKGNSQQMSKPGGGNVVVDVKTFARLVQELDFSRCIVDHNLTWIASEDGPEQPFDFKNDRSAFDRLDAQIAEEIGQYIDELNNFDENDKEMLAQGKEVSTLDSSMLS